MSWAKPILICLSLVTLFLFSIIIHQRKVLMYTKHYKNERKRILSNSMSKSKGFYETPNAGNDEKMFALMTVMLVTSLCWWRRYVGDISIADQHHNIPECDGHSTRQKVINILVINFVGRIRVLLWWCDLSPTSKSCNQHIWS